jgi:hypothetical protein
LNRSRGYNDGFWAVEEEGKNRNVQDERERHSPGSAAKADFLTRPHTVSLAPIQLDAKEYRR